MAAVRALRLIDQRISCSLLFLRRQEPVYIKVMSPLAFFAGEAGKGIILYLKEIATLDCISKGLTN